MIVPNLSCQSRRRERAEGCGGESAEDKTAKKGKSKVNATAVSTPRVSRKTLIA